MPADYARLKAILANSKIQTENNALFQSINGLIQAVQEDNSSAIALINALQAQVSGISNGIFIVNSDTSVSAQLYELSEYVTASRGFVIFKDLSGNAATNNITLVGTVEGAVDPTISTNFGLYKVYLGSDGDFHTW